MPDWEKYEAWKAEQQRTTPVDVQKNFEILEAMYEHARALGKFPTGHPMENIDVKIRIAKAFNVQTTPPADSETS